MIAVGIRLGLYEILSHLGRALFQTHVTGWDYNRNHYAVTKDGQRFLVNTPVEEASSNPITGVLNWTADLRR